MLLQQNTDRVIIGLLVSVPLFVLCVLCAGTFVMSCDPGDKSRILVDFVQCAEQRDIKLADPTIRAVDVAHAYIRLDAVLTKVLFSGYMLGKAHRHP